MRAPLAIPAFPVAQGVGLPFFKGILPILIDDGDVIMFTGIVYVNSTTTPTMIDRYLLAPYVCKEYRILNHDSNETPDFIISRQEHLIFENFTLVNRYYTRDKRGLFTQIKKEVLVKMGKGIENEKKPRMIR